MSDSIFEVEREASGDVIFRLKPPAFWGLPESTRQHLLTAQKEVLLAMRSVLDTAIEKTEELEKPKEKMGKTKIEVQ